MSTHPGRSAPFVVYGPSKSGTTWVQKMLDAHPDVSCEFQPKLLIVSDRERAPGRGVAPAVATPFGGLFTDPEDEELYRAKSSFLKQINFLRADYPRTTVPDASPEVMNKLTRLHRRMARSLVEAYLDETSDALVKGYKSHVDIDFLMELFPDAKIIFIVRDGRDVCVSMRHHRLRQGVYYPGDERSAILRLLNKLPLSRRVTKGLVARHPRLRDVLFKDLTTGQLFGPASLGKAAFDWTIIIDYLLERREAYPDNQLLVRYEDLLVNPAEHLEKMLSFIGADASDTVIKGIVEEMSMSKLKGTEKAGFFRKGISGDWRNAFTEDDVDQFKKIAGDRLIRLGYENDNDWTL